MCKVLLEQLYRLGKIRIISMANCRLILQRINFFLHLHRFLSNLKESALISIICSEPKGRFIIASEAQIAKCLQQQVQFVRNLTENQVQYQSTLLETVSHHLKSPAVTKVWKDFSSKLLDQKKLPLMYNNQTKLSSKFSFVAIIFLSLSYII